MTKHAWRVNEAQAQQRLDQCVLSELQFHYSRARIQRWLAAGCIHLNEAVAPAHRRVRAGDTITVDLEAAYAHEPVRTLIPEPIPLSIVFEDLELLVVNKPAGLVTHPAPGHWSGTLVNAVLWYLQRQGAQAVTPATRPAIHPPEDHALNLRPGILHRLDKGTSGLLIVAKTADAHYALAKQLKQRKIHRLYLACVAGLIACDEGTVEAPIGRHPVDRKRMSIRRDNGRSAITHYRLRHRVTQPHAALHVEPYSVVECRLETGRTHQVRLHMAHLGHPILGDATYGRGHAKLPRQLLHAVQLTFQHPSTQESLTLTAPVPDDMAPFIPARA